MFKIKKTPNPARLCGYSGSEISGALADMAGTESLRIHKPISFKKLTEEQKIRLKAAGYDIPEDNE